MKRSAAVVRLAHPIIFLLITVLRASAAPLAPVVPVQAQASDHFDSKIATDAWLATVPASEKARSDAYFEGGYWLILWDFLYLAGAMLILLETKLSARMRNAAERLSGSFVGQTAIYWLEFAAITAAMLFPLDFYENFVRERQYGLLSQAFASWMRDQSIGLAAAIVLFGIGFVILAAVVRRFEKTWHIWATVASVGLLIGSAAITPVFLEPLFNRFTPVQDVKIKDAILALARANGLSASDVYEEDTSRRSKEVSAHVSGLLATERITLNDNLLNRCSEQGVMATMGHEIGHYVMHHIMNGVVFYSIVFAVMFALLRRTMACLLARWGERWKIRSVSDIAALPLAVILLATMSFLFTPIGNTYTRTQEYEADLYGLNTARQPDGEAEVDLLLGEYRKLDPSPLEEFLFYDHPSGRTRIYAAMRWKAENLCLFDAKLKCTSQPGK